MSGFGATGGLCTEIHFLNDLHKYIIPINQWHKKILIDQVECHGTQHSRQKGSHHVELKTTDSMGYYIITSWLKFIETMPCNFLHTTEGMLMKTELEIGTAKILQF